ncbi:hypothetical protein [Nocardiopsis composta]|uniref:Uncharacterized protein n=1 Tax=Nocardiopsis composta TaxID=157465 RepID=A0A7W8QHX9_9ACTN|nr:hypothetical protein [Nocardiopsis composta]MBB5430534.1 hypothetical protein [Nocardiopsis composta]
MDSHEYVSFPAVGMESMTGGLTVAVVPAGRFSFSRPSRKGFSRERLADAESPSGRSPQARGPAAIEVRQAWRRPEPRRHGVIGTLIAARIRSALTGSDRLPVVDGTTGGRAIAVIESPGDKAPEIR